MRRSLSTSIWRCLRRFGLKFKHPKLWTSAEPEARQQVLQASFPKQAEVGRNLETCRSFRVKFPAFWSETKVSESSFQPFVWNLIVNRGVVSCFIFFSWNLVLKLVQVSNFTFTTPKLRETWSWKFRTLIFFTLKFPDSKLSLETWPQVSNRKFTVWNFKNGHMSQKIRKLHEVSGTDRSFTPTISPHQQKWELMIVHFFPLGVLI